MRQDHKQLVFVWAWATSVTMPLCHWEMFSWGFNNTDVVFPAASLAEAVTSKLTLQGIALCFAAFVFKARRSLGSAALCHLGEQGGHSPRLAGFFLSSR